MLFNHIRDAHSGVDIEQLICSLNEAIQADTLRDACRKFVQRNDAFRTSFHWENHAQPYRQVSAYVEPPFSLTDLSTLPPAAQFARLNRFLEQDRTEGFSLDRAPLFRFSLFKQGDSDYKLIWTFHHAIMDGRSFPVALSELFALYEGQRDGSVTELPAPLLQSRFIESLNGLDLTSAERFWKNYLNGFEAANPVPALDPPDGDSGFSEQETALSEPVAQALRKMAAEHGITLNALVQAAWALVLSRYTGSRDIVFGATRACRGADREAAMMIGTFINTLPVRIRLNGEDTLSDWLKGIRASQLAVRDFEQTPLASIQRWSKIPPGTPLFETILVFDNYDLNRRMQSLGGAWTHRQVQLRERTGFPLTLYGYADAVITLRLAYDRTRFSDPAVRRMLGLLEAILEAMPGSADLPLSRLPVLTAEDHRQLAQWNETRLDYPHDRCIHDLIEEQADRTPNATAVVFRDRSLTYRELDERANRLAHLLASKNVRPGDRVAVLMERNLDLMVALLATLKAGAAYVPLDPAYPPERLRYVLSDAQVALVLTQEFADSAGMALQECSAGRPDVTRSSDSIAYVIYTSGSTGQPKGVMVSHRNVMNFFAGMPFSERNRRIGDPPGVWLAVTSISFDISVLELFWTLARGFQVVIQEDNLHLPAPTQGSTSAKRKLDFSLFYFASDDGKNGDKYKLLLEGAKFADRNGFSAIWTPERHFHAFGGLFPNPAVTSAALAMITKNLQIRAGSVVLPLHDPIRVAEEWALVDNLSAGRAGISVASGWHDRDFVFAPANFTQRKSVLLRDLETVRKLWRGESILRQSGSGSEVNVSIFPRPIQPELPVWITAGGDPQTFRLAGEAGASLLTHLLGQTPDDLASKIQIYRDAYRQSGHAGHGHVTLMLHTFVGANPEEVQRQVRAPFCNYLKSSVDLMSQVVKGLGAEFAGASLSREDLEALIDYAFDRYAGTSGLFGTPETCAQTVEKLRSMGVDEVACLVDFGIAAETVLANLDNLRELMERANQDREPGYSIPEQIARYRVTHMQSTPSLARMLVGDASGREALGQIQKLLIGGEALPPSLAAELHETGAAEIYNMYGPTETTIWSTMEKLRPGAEVSIGRPIANTSVFVLDSDLRPVPIGVPAELYIGGDGVTPGYLDRPELTRERFVEIDGRRTYRTGDLVKFLPDGRLAFLGRLDHQVKIRGHRVELGEIESALCRHENIQDAIVSAVAQSQEDHTLAAYVIPRGDAPRPVELRRFLESHLPGHMIPASYVFLDAFPRTPNGKIDRKRLPAPDSIAEPHAIVQPRNSIERQIASLWQELLHADQVGIHDNFFDLGGHSLTAVMLTGRIRSAINSQFPLRAVLDHPTIAGQAEQIENLRYAVAPPLKPARPPILRAATR